MSQGVFARDKFGISQKHFAIGEKYFVRDLETNEDLLWVERDRMGRYTHLHVYADKTKSQKFLHLEDQAWMDALGKWTIVDVETNQPMVRLKRKFLKSWFWRESYDILSPTEQPIGKIESRGGFFVTMVRKIGLPLPQTSFPFVSWWGIGRWIRLQFDVFLFDEQGQEQKVMEYNRKRTLRDNYVIDCTFDTKGLLDRKLAVALGLILDSAEQR